MATMRRFRWLRRTPLTCVEALIGFSSVVAGAYLVSPLLAISTYLNGATPLVLALGSTIGISIFGGLFLASGVLMLYGIYARHYKVRSGALFLNILVRTYGLIAGFLVQGLLPLTWLPNFVLLLISVICYLVVRGMIVRGLDRNATD